MTVTIRQLPTTAVRDAGRLLTRAFAADPIITHFLAAPRRRRFAFPAFFRAIIYEHLDAGHVYGAWEGERLIGVAVWAPPDGLNPKLVGRVFSAADHLVVRMLFPRRARGLYNGFAETASLHPIEPHWYLGFVGIEPDYQGHGLGERLLGPVLKTADADNTLCYLETPFPATHKFYKRLGFALEIEARPFQGAPALWTMLRRPQVAMKGLQE